MKNLFTFVIMIAVLSSITIAKDPKFIGVKKCSMCHKSAKQGEQLKIWEASAHANAYKTLQSAESDKIAADMGIKGKAVEAVECLKCHASGYDVDQALLDKKFKIEDGVQCETCHGAGSEYKSMKVMKDHAKSVAAGMTDYTAEGAAEAQCKTCHNEESPTYKPFDFAKKWEMIAHPVPEKK